MFYLYTQYLAKRYSLKTVTWNFCEAGHGKGPMDGVGAVIKRTADRIVAQGSDIPDFNTLMRCIRENTTNVIISTVTTKQIEELNKLLQRKINSVPGITKVHQMTWDSHMAQKIFLRKLTCLTCASGERCLHYSLPDSYVEFSNPLKIFESLELESETETPPVEVNEENLDRREETDERDSEEQEEEELASETEGEEDNELESESEELEDRGQNSEAEEQEDMEPNSKAEGHEDEVLDSESEEQEKEELDSETEEQKYNELDSETEELEDRERGSETEEQEDLEPNSKAEKHEDEVLDSESEDFNIF
ncbi:unnamed protein product [Parnassius apollo]|uniref:(apollo) hypothetical protein n=1 Tax=Parnassius apollo TaxID=110799 RepID=A0A8S3XUD1_PARAO|nr:unnamed protein product [Parnassius apollo]